MSNGNFSLSEQDLLKIQVRALTAGTDELYRDIGNALPKEAQDAVAAGLRFPSPADIGRAFRDSLLPVVKDGICGKAKYCKNRHIYDTAAKVSGLVAEHVVEAIALAHGIPPGIAGKSTGLAIDISSSILKEGLNHLCQCDEAP